MTLWSRRRFWLSCLSLGVWGIFCICGCVAPREAVDLKPHVNKMVLQVNELANQVYDLETRLRKLESRETRVPDHIKRLADLEARFTSLQEEARSHFTAEQESMGLWRKLEQKVQDLQQELHEEREKFHQLQEEIEKRVSSPLSQAIEPQPGVTRPKVLHPAEPDFRPKEDASPPGPLPSISVAPPPSDQADEKSVYEDAYQTFRQEEWAAARKKFQDFLDRYPKSSLSDNAQFWIGESFYKQKEYERAILSYEKVIQNYPGGDKLPSALLKQAFAFYEIGRLKEARILLNQVIKKAPESEQAQIAGKKLEAIAGEETAH